MWKYDILTVIIRQITCAYIKSVCVLLKHGLRLVWKRSRVIELSFLMIMARFLFWDIWESDIRYGYSLLNIVFRNIWDKNIWVDTLICTYLVEWNNWLASFYKTLVSIKMVKPNLERMLQVAVWEMLVKCLLVDSLISKNNRDDFSMFLELAVFVVPTW